MRINLTHVNAHLVTELFRAGSIVDIQHNSGDLVLADLPTGEEVMIHLVERDIDVGLIRDTLAEDNKANRHTLFILWCDMLLPDDGQMYLPYDWMSALLTVYGDKIYAFDTNGKHAFIFPVYFERQEVGLKRFIRHGSTVDMASLWFDSIHTEGQHIKGIWRIAHFEGRYAAWPKTRAGEQPSQDTDREWLAPERNPMQAYYDILGVARDADWETIKKAYRELALKYHPDLNKTPEANERMQQLNRAYDQISKFLEGRSAPNA
jgi:hypothetical protein